jgi:hypothetical protein
LVCVNARLDSVIDELYGVLPGEFVAVRDDHAARARAEGDRELADQITALRRPTQSAWLVNLLWRERRADVQELLELADRFREAPGSDDPGAELRELSGQRRRLLERLGEQAGRLASDAGIRVGASTVREAESTLEAAVADPDVAERVRAGRLTKAESYAGFGDLGGFPFPVPTKPDRAAQDRAAQQRERAEERVREARAERDRTAAGLDEAERLLAQQTQRVEQARSAHATAERRLQKAEAELGKLTP